MAFRKAKARQGALKLALYGAAGSGKTFTALWAAEYLAAKAKKRVAFVDTERGTDFYSQTVKERRVHPEAFDFDCVYTKAITEVLAEVNKLDPKEHNVLVLDSITHIWEACLNSYTGKRTKIGSIPMQAWGTIKRPYKQLIQWILSTPLHVIICGRQGNDWQTDDETEELVNVGYKMKAEGETAYEPHILIRMEAVRTKKGGDAVITGYAEKDRTGILAGKVIQWPTPENIVVPLLGVLGDEQATVSADDAADKDADTLIAQEVEKTRGSAEKRRKYESAFIAANSREEVEKVSKEITAALKRTMVPGDVDALREAYRAAAERFGG